VATGGLSAQEAARSSCTTSSTRARARRSSASATSSSCHDTQKRLADAARAGQSATAIRGDVAPDLIALLLMALVMGVEEMLEVGFDFDIRAGAAATLKLLRQG